MACPNCGDIGRPGQMVCDNCGFSHDWWCCGNCVHYVDETDCDGYDSDDQWCKFRVSGVWNAKRACIYFEKAEDDNW